MSKPLLWTILTGKYIQIGTKEKTVRYCRENRVREFRFKFIHRIVVTKKELFLGLISTQIVTVYNCGDLDSIDHTFSECQFTKSFTQEVLQWFNTEND